MLGVLLAILVLACSLLKFQWLLDLFTWALNEAEARQSPRVQAPGTAQEADEAAVERSSEARVKFAGSPSTLQPSRQAGSPTPFSLQSPSSSATEPHQTCEGTSWQQALDDQAAGQQLLPKPSTGSSDADELAASAERALIQSISLGHTLAAARVSRSGDFECVSTSPDRTSFTLNAGAEVKLLWDRTTSDDGTTLCPLAAMQAARTSNDTARSPDAPRTPLAPPPIRLATSSSPPHLESPQLGHITACGLPTSPVGDLLAAFDAVGPVSPNSTTSDVLPASSLVGPGAVARKRLVTSGRNNFAVIAAANRAVASAVAAANTQQLLVHSSRGFGSHSDGSTDSLSSLDRCGSAADADSQDLSFSCFAQRPRSMEIPAVRDTGSLLSLVSPMSVPGASEGDAGVRQVSHRSPGYLIGRRSKSSPGTATEGPAHSPYAHNPYQPRDPDPSAAQCADTSIGPLSMCGLVGSSQSPSPEASVAYRPPLGVEGAIPSFVFHAPRAANVHASGSMSQPLAQLRLCTDLEQYEASNPVSHLAVLPADFAPASSRPSARSSTGWAWPTSGGSSEVHDAAAVTDNGTLSPPPHTMDILAAAFGWPVHAAPEAASTDQGQASDRKPSNPSLGDEVEEMLAHTWRSTSQSMRPFSDRGLPAKAMSFNGKSPAPTDPLLPAVATQQACSHDGQADVRNTRSSMRAPRTTLDGRHHKLGRSQTFNKKGVSFKDVPEDLERLSHAQSQPVVHRMSKKLTGTETITVPEPPPAVTARTSSSGRKLGAVADGLQVVPRTASDSAGAAACNQPPQLATSPRSMQPAPQTFQGLVQHLSHLELEQPQYKSSSRKASAGYLAAKATPFAMHPSIASSSTHTESRAESLKVPASGFVDMTGPDGRGSVSGLTDATLLSSAYRTIGSDQGGSESGAAAHSSDANSHRTGRVDARVKVMLVSSEAGTMMTINTALPSIRYEVQYASGADCIRLLCKDNAALPDVLLLDCQLQAMPSPQLARHLSRTRSNASSDMSTMTMMCTTQSCHSAEPVTALSIIESLRGKHDPSVLPIIALASPPVAGSEAMSSTGGSLMVFHNAVAQAELDKLEAAPHIMAAREGVEALKRGANDYVVLPVLTVELEARINMQVALRRAMRLKAEAYSSMQLLRAILPGHVIRKLKQGHKYIAQYHKDVSIGFVDIVNFTRMSANWPSSKVAQMLNDLFSRYDLICERHGVYHVDTIGDGYMVLCGHDGEADHALKLMRAAVEMLNISKEPLSNGETISIRIGINTGPAHSGVLGTKRFKYTVWGDSVNCASRMESTGFTNCIQITASTYRSVLASMIAHRSGADPSMLSSSHMDADLDRSSFGTSVMSGQSGTQGFHEGSHVNDGGSSRWGADSSRPSTAFSHAAASSKARTTISGEQLPQSTPRPSEGGEPYEFSFVSLGLREIKGKGLMPTYLVKTGSWQEAQIQYSASQQQWQSPTHYSTQRVSAPSSRNLASKSSHQSSSTESHGTQYPGSKLRPIMQGRPQNESEDEALYSSHTQHHQSASHAMQQGMQARHDWRVGSGWQVVHEDGQYIAESARVFGRNTSFNHQSYGWSDSLHLESLRPSAYRSSEYRDSYPDGRPPPPPSDMCQTQTPRSSNWTPHRPLHPLASVNNSGSVQAVLAVKHTSLERPAAAERPGPASAVPNRSVEAQLREVLSRHHPENLDPSKRAALLNSVSQQLFPPSMTSESQEPIDDTLPLHPEAAQVSKLTEQLRNPGPSSGQLRSKPSNSYRQAASDPFLKPQAVVFGNPTFGVSQGTFSDDGAPAQDDRSHPPHGTEAQSSGRPSPAVTTPRTSTTRSSAAGLKSSKSIKKVGTMFKALVGPKSKSGPQNAMLKAISKVAAHVEALASPRASRDTSSPGSSRVSRSSAASHSKHPRIGLSKSRVPSLTKEGWMQRMSMRVPAASASGVPGLGVQLRTGSLTMADPRLEAGAPTPSAQSETGIQRDQRLAGFAQMAALSGLGSPKTSDSQIPLQVQYRLTAHGTLEPKALTTEFSATSSASRSTPRLSRHASHGDAVQTKLSSQLATKESGRLGHPTEKLAQGIQAAGDLAAAGTDASIAAVGVPKRSATQSYISIPSNLSTGQTLPEHPSKLSFTSAGGNKECMMRQTLPGTSTSPGAVFAHQRFSQFGATSTADGSAARSRDQLASTTPSRSSSSKMHRPKVVKKIMQWLKER